MKKLFRNSLVCLLIAALLLACAAQTAFAEAPCEIVIETVTLGAPYADIPAVEDAINAITVPAINVRVRILNVGIAQHERRITQMINTREKVDLVMVGLTLPMSSMVAAGMLLPLDAPLAVYGADIESLMDGQLDAGRLHGALYAIPADAYTAQAGGFVYNKQMADELGIEVPDPLTFEELTRIFGIVREKLPGVYATSFGTGNIPSVMFLNNMESYDSYTHCYGVTFHQYDSTRIVNLYASQLFRRHLMQQREWMKQGYVVPDSMTSGILSQEYMAAGEIFGMVTNYSPIEAPTQQSNSSFPIEIVKITRPARSTSAIQERMWGIPVSCENPEKAMEFLNLMYANADVANLLSNGIEGLNYKFVDENVITYADGVDPANPGYGRVFSRFGDQMKLYQWLPATPNYQAELAEFNESALDSRSLGYTFDPDPVAAEVAAVNEVIALYLPPLECGLVDDVDTAIAEFNTQLENAGIDRIIAENQRQLDMWLETR